MLLTVFLSLADSFVYSFVADIMHNFLSLVGQSVWGFLWPNYIFYGRLITSLLFHLLVIVLAHLGLYFCPHFMVVIFILPFSIDTLISLMRFYNELLVIYSYLDRLKLRWVCFAHDVTVDIFKFDGIHMYVPSARCHCVLPCGAKA